jgi:hypothetical protein
VVVLTRPISVFGYQEWVIFALTSGYYFMQALHAQSSVAVGMKGASKAMEAMNKVTWFIVCLNYI